MKPTLCSKCKKNLAVVFITKIENGETINEGYCLKCAKELGIKPVDDMISRMGLSDEDLESISGEMLGELYVWKKDVYERDLRELGFYLGKFIYLCDSFEDVEQDIKKKNYNPLVERFERPEFEAESRMMLEDMMARACRAFECLPLLEDAPIMRNILYSGIWLRFEGACERRKAKSKQ